MSAHDDPALYRRYSMTVEWSDKDHAYIVTVPELPGCVTHGDTREEAVKQGEAAVESWIDAARAWGRPVPAPRVVVASRR
ncbi:MAG TPA: type II toxin-antitoxin system HicB family antitoxin [Thermomicrobiales bacterium]|nr:type II toxin-antitoxin system HicB family antitoxin [Thermomicrobiales bacterium]